jgi:pimeloyl-ACP methyl ester carboxylesterase
MTPMRAAHIFFMVLVVASLSGCMAFNIFLRSPQESTETKYAATSDGWELGVYHYPATTAKKDKPPVILCHGMGVNSYFWNVLPENDLPSYLSRRGYDVWTLDLRGCGNSHRKNRFMRFVGFDLKREEKDPYYWTLDDYARYDLPAVIDMVREESGQDAVTWIGHSMGGMVMFAYLASMEEDQTDKVANFVALGSPVLMPQPPEKFVSSLEEMPEWLLQINAKYPAKSVAVVAPTFETPLDVMYYNKDNMDGQRIARMYANVMDNFQLGVIRQMKILVKEGEFKSHDETLNYRASLGRITCPSLFVAAKADPLGTPMSLNTSYREISSEDKSYLLLSRANGFRTDYGHCDMIMGRFASKEVFPQILAWLDEH